MGHTYSNLLTHVIFSTKDRVPYLDREHRHDVFAYLGGITRKVGGTPLNIGGYDDHVHCLIRLTPSIPVADVVKKIKANSSRWIHEQRMLHRSFAWQEGYAAFSVCESSVLDVSKYITEQEEHHRKMSFQEELIAFLNRNQIAYDERYIWT